MTLRHAEPPRPRPGRGRPQGGRGGDRNRGAPTRTRLVALRVLERVQRAGAYADIALQHALSRSGLSAPDRAFATGLVYGTLRWRGRIDHLLRHVVDRDLDKLEPLVANALRLGAYQLIFHDDVPSSAAVDESVRCVRALGAERATGLVNAVLRRLAREHEEVPLPSLAADPVGHLTHALSLPAWIAERFLDRFGPEEAAALAAASNAPPPLTVRANCRMNGREELLGELVGRFPEAVPCRVARHGLVLGRHGNPGVDPAFLEGRFTVQDESSQLVVGLLDPQPGERVLDTCAAPGGKATAIAERVGPEGVVVALDRNDRRLGLVRRATRRLGLENVACVVGDATRALGDVLPAPSFDRVLVDAPCSGLGTLRRHSDARWRLRPGDPARLAQVQTALLHRAATTVKPGGVLVYGTCTLLPVENEAIIDDFLKRQPDFSIALGRRIPAEVASMVDADGALRCLPHRHDMDGFYAVRLERQT